jgi:hypothetical protein
MIVNVYERRASMSVLGDYSKVSRGYSDPLNVLPNGMITNNTRNNRKHHTKTTVVNKYKQLDKSQQTENVRKTICAHNVGKRDAKNVNHKDPLDFKAHVQKGLLTHKGNCSQLYKNVLHKSQMQLLNEWMTKQLGNSLDDINTNENSFEDKQLKGKISLTVL